MNIALKKDKEIKKKEEKKERIVPECIWLKKYIFDEGAFTNVSTEQENFGIIKRSAQITVNEQQQKNNFNFVCFI